ncbi:MAG: hypothetical protein WC877_00555 [Dehalococcoidales bacterium]|jgi:hypothetical protein
MVKQTIKTKPTKVTKIKSVNEPVKTCTGCQKTLPISSFYKHKSMPDGLTYMCKACYSGRYHSQTIPTRKKSNTPSIQVSQITQVTQVNPIKPIKPIKQSKQINIFNLTSDEFNEIIPENVPFTITDILKLTNTEESATNRSKVQTRIYTLIENNIIERVEQLHNKSIVYMKKNTQVKDLIFESRTCLKCNEPLHLNDIANNPHTKLCSKCTTALTKIEKSITIPTTTSEDMERLTTSMRNEIVVMNEKLNNLNENSRSLHNIEAGLMVLQDQMTTLIKIFAINCKTLPDNINPAYIS